jgi:hypothetical protein
MGQLREGRLDELPSSSRNTPAIRRLFDSLCSLADQRSHLLRLLPRPAFLCPLLISHANSRNLLTSRLHPTPSSSHPSPSEVARLPLQHARRRRRTGDVPPCVHGERLLRLRRCGWKRAKRQERRSDSFGRGGEGLEGFGLGGGEGEGLDRRVAFIE